MIRLHRTMTPASLNPKNAARLTEEYACSGVSVWSNDDIKDALLAIGNRKCAYCETVLNRQSTYLEVEHFHHKDEFPGKVVEWDNLLPACRRCNGKKGRHNVEIEPIINPFRVEPKDHLSLRLYRLRSKSTLGRSTIEVLDLNNHDRAVMARFEIGESVLEAVSICQERLSAYLDDATTRRKNKLVGTVEALLNECQRSAPYAATSASVLCSSKEFAELRQSMMVMNIWTDELERLWLTATELAMEEG